MAEKLTGALYSYQTHFLYLGPLIASAPHKHHAGQVMWVPNGLVVEDERRCERHATVHIESEVVLSEAARARAPARAASAAAAPSDVPPAPSASTRR